MAERRSPREEEDRSPAEAADEDVIQPLSLRRRAARRGPFMTGLTWALGVATAYLLFRAVVDVADVLLLIGVSLFLAVGFDPVIVRLAKVMPRLVAVVLVVAVLLGLMAGFVVAALPPISHEVTELSKQLPTYRHDIMTGKGWLGQLAVRTHLNTYLGGKSSSHSTSTVSLSLLGGILGAGKLVLSALYSIVVVAILTLYFMVTLPSVRTAWLRFIPATNRSQVAALTDQSFLRVGGFVLGDILTSVVTGIGTTVWAFAFGLPYPLLLGVMVALLDLIPVVGSTVGGVVVSLVAVTKGLPVAIATLVFYVAYRFIEDQLLNPLVMRRTVKVSAGVTIVSTLIGAALLGILGALIAVPIAATIEVVLEELAYPTLNRS